MSRKIELSAEVADGIAVLVLQDYMKYLKQELKDFKNGSYLHPEDVTHNTKMIESIKYVLKDFGV
jgi:hypothetical protein